MKILKSLLIALLLFVFTVPAFSQYLETSKQSGIGLPFFELAIQDGFNNDLQHHKLLIMAHFLYDDLTFIKSDTSGFDTSFEILFAVYDKKGNVVDNHTINRKINVKDFNLTNSRSKSIILKDSFDLLPGEYTLLAKSTDLITNKSAKRKIKFKMEDFAKKPVALGSLLFLQDVTLDSTGKVIGFLPTFGNNFAVKKGAFYIYFDAYTQKVNQPLKIRYQFKGEQLRRNKRILEIDTTIVLTPKTAVFHQLFKLDRNRLTHNKYLLTVELISGKKKAKTEQPFSFFWSSVPTTKEDIDLALQQMSYILNPDTLKKYLKAPLAEKQAFFKRFWKERDPDPTTAKNELKDEYFRRVNYANQHFSTMTLDGWQTDRGRILIKFGFPDDIERHPFEINGPPYEIWQYYSLRKTFLFVDYTGFGDYRLDPRFIDMEYE